jgi:hypothetical protein
MKERDHQEEARADERIILKFILRNEDGRMWTLFICSSEQVIKFQILYNACNFLNA